MLKSIGLFSIFFSSVLLISGAEANKVDELIKKRDTLQPQFEKALEDMFKGIKSPPEASAKCKDEMKKSEGKHEKLTRECLEHVKKTMDHVRNTQASSKPADDKLKAMGEELDSINSQIVDELLNDPNVK